MKRILFISVLLALTVVLGASGQNSSTHDSIQTLPDGTKYLVHPSEIKSGGPPPDGIPSIDNPKFVSVKEADSWLADDDIVVVYQQDDIARFYPFQILVWHEIVNDTVDGFPLLITYCPLCGSAIAFERTIDGEPVEFGTSGKLYNSNLVMYDRKTRTYWTQIGGRAIIGDLVGEELTPVSINTVQWGNWKHLYPDAEVLSRETGHFRSYGRDPYGGYYSQDYLMFPVENLDKRIHSKTVIYGIKLNGVHKAYPENLVLKESIINDAVGGTEITITINKLGGVRMAERDSGREVVFERDFWFAWAAFYPETLLFGSESDGESS
ncbi:MAG: hypothetical protein CMN78_04475 [Spirochaetales bacterium]|nr:hypothetical protein [Spirochaetales bacterium]